MLTRYMIPMFVVVDAMNEQDALDIANTIRHAGEAVCEGEGACDLLFDEELPVKKSEIRPGHELPHTYNDYSFV